MTTTSSLYLYSLTLQPPTDITHVISGQFAGQIDGKRAQQLVLTASGSRLTLLRIDVVIEDGDAVAVKTSVILAQDIFGIIRSIAAFRQAGNDKDYIIIASDSGRIAIVEYLPSQNRFSRLQLETFGKSGVRRVIPGQYLALDPKGRACMIASVEKNKLVYVLNRNAQAQLTISSPLEAHKPQTLLFALVGLDTGYENPVFAALEVDYSESEHDPAGQAYEETEKTLCFYELDLGLNHVVRKYSDTVDRTANYLLQVPGGTEGPSGVIVCAEDNISYRHMNQSPHLVPIPRRRGATEDPERKRRIVTGVMHKTKRQGFFALVQTEDGDLFKLTIDLERDGDGKPTGALESMHIKYFGTVPVATNLVILKSGLLFVACESGDHLIYRFLDLAENTDDPQWSSADFSADPAEESQPVYFHPRDTGNLTHGGIMATLNPLMGSQVANLTNEDAPQIYAICGQAARSSFKTIRHGLAVTHLAEEQLPQVPLAVWTTKLKNEDEYHSFIILAFTNSTLVLSVGDSIEEAEDSQGLLLKHTTLLVQLMADDSWVQVYPRGLRRRRSSGHVDDWDAPQHRTIVAATANERQVALALSSGELVYFELDSDGSLAEFEDRKEMSGTVTCLSLGDVPEGRQRSPFLAVGCDDSTVRVLSLDPEAPLENRAVQALTSAPASLSITTMTDPASGGSALYLHLGLHSGVYIRTGLDEVSGELSDTRTRFLGPKPVKLFRVVVNSQTAVLALSTRSWLGYIEPHSRSFQLAPLDYDELGGAGNFCAGEFREAVVGLSGQDLRIFTISGFNTNLVTKSIPLANTPRQFYKHPTEPLFYIVESDNNILPPDMRQRLQNDPAFVNGDVETTHLPPNEFGYPRGRGYWSSNIQIVAPLTNEEVVYTVELEENEAAVSAAIVPFESQDDETFLVVGTGKDMVISPRSFTCGFIHIYRLNDKGRSLEFIHKTRVEEPPLALLAFQGRVLAGVGKLLRVYDLGMKQLVRKAQARVVPNLIVTLESQGFRIIVGDLSQSVFFVVYKPAENLLLPFADDTVARWTTCNTLTDYSSVAGGDKFGNLWLVRCDQRVSDEADEQGAAAHLVHERGYLHGTANRLDLIAHFFVNDIPTSIHRTPLVPGGQDVLLWSGLSGTLGVLIPFISREDVELFSLLVDNMRAEEPPLAGRDHLIYRGYYVPVKGVVDGDLCERFRLLPLDKKAQIAAALDRSVREIERKVEDMRTRAAY